MKLLGDDEIIGRTILAVVESYSVLLLVFGRQEGYAIEAERDFGEGAEIKTNVQEETIWQSIDHRELLDSGFITQDDLDYYLKQKETEESEQKKRQTAWEMGELARLKAKYE